MSTIESEPVSHLKKGLRILCGDHGFEKFPVAVSASKVTMASRHTDRCKTVLLEGKGVIVVGNSPRKGESEFIAEMGLAKSKSFGLEVS
jgi:hypothetical protein